MYRPAQHPLVADRDQPGDDERAARHLLEHGRAHVRPDPIGQVVDQTLHHEGGPVLALHLERALHHVAPAEHHLPFGLRQVRPGLDELLHHRPAVRQPVLEHEQSQSSIHRCSSASSRPLPYSARKLDAART
jgi:hypothetical protein